MKIENKSRHAAIRSQQCGIPQLIIDWLITYGATTMPGAACPRTSVFAWSRCWDA